MNALPACTPDRWVCVGRSMAIDARRAGAEAAAEAQRDRPAKLLIVFSSIHYDCADVLAGICFLTFE